MISSGFFFNLFFLLQPWLCYSKAVGHQIDIKWVISREEFLSHIFMGRPKTSESHNLSSDNFKAWWKHELIHLVHISESGEDRNNLSSIFQVIEKAQRGF